MAILRLEQLFLGPRDNGRNYGILAATRDLRLPSAAVSACQAFNMDIGDYIDGRSDIHAYFQISAPPARELWYLCSTRLYESAGRNRVWLTAGWILTRDDIDALDGAAYLLLLKQTALPVAPPIAGSELSPLVVDTDALLKRSTVGGASLHAEDAARMLSMPNKSTVIFAIEPPVHVLPSIAAFLSACDPFTRKTTAFITVLAPIRTWSFIAYDASKYPDAARSANRNLQIAFVGSGGIKSDYRRDPVEDQWFDLVHRVRAKSVYGGEMLGQRLQQAAQKSAQPGSASTLARRILMALDGLSEDDARAAFVRLAAATASLEPKSKFPALADALFDTLEARVSASAKPWAWIEDCFESLKGGTISPFQQLGPPPKMLARLAVRSNALPRLRGPDIVKLGSLLTSNLAGDVMRQIADIEPHPPLDHALLYLATGVVGTELEVPETTLLAIQVVGRALAIEQYSLKQDVDYNLISAKKIVLLLLQSFLNYGRARGLLRLFYGDSEARMRRAFKVGELQLLLSKFHAAATLRLRTRDESKGWAAATFGLALWKIGRGES